MWIANNRWNNRSQYITSNSEWKGNPAKLTLNRGRRFYVELIRLEEYRPEEYQNKTSDSTLNWMGLSLD